MKLAGCHALLLAAALLVPASARAAKPRPKRGAPTAPEPTRRGPPTQPEADEWQQPEAPARTAPPARAPEATTARATPEAPPDEDESLVEEDDPHAASREPAPAHPRVSLALGFGVAGRTFDYDVPLQHEASFPRATFAAALELLPLEWLGVRGALAGLGLGARASKGFGKAVLPAGAGPEVRLPVDQRSLALDVRYAWQPLDRLTIVPSIGVGHRTNGIDGAARLEPSRCAATSAELCLARISLLHATAGVEARFAPLLAWRFEARVLGLAGLHLAGGAGDLASESDVRSLGWAAGLGAVHDLLPWLGLRLGADVVSFGHTFLDEAVPYASASDRSVTVELGPVIAF